MRIRRLLTLSFSACCLALTILPPSSAKAPAQDSERKKEHYWALAFYPYGGGRRTTANVDIYVNKYSSDEEANLLKGALIDGGPQALLKTIQKLDSKGRISLTGRVGFYDFKFIRERETETGRRIVCVTDRPLGFLELYAGARSTDYTFGIVILDLEKNKKGKEEGTGQMMYAVKVKFKNGNMLELEHYGIAPISLRNVRAL
jgi:hypothetical protein